MPDGPRTPDQEAARRCGFDLLDLSLIYERGVVRDEAGFGTVAIAGLVARTRRLLRATYVLADEGCALEAAILLRSMVEFLIRQRWLQLSPRLNHVLWAAEDLKARLRMDEEIRGLLPEGHAEAVKIMEPEIREQYRRSLDEMRQQLAQAQAELGLQRAPRFPKLWEQARDAGAQLAYSLAYRYDSHAAAHPSAMAIEQLMEAAPGGVRLLPAPAAGRAYADPYPVGAFLLNDALKAAGEQIPELVIRGREEVEQRLLALVPRDADPPPA